MTRSIEIAGRRCTIYGVAGPCFLYGYKDWENIGQECPDGLLKKVLELSNKEKGQAADVETVPEFVIAAYESEDWDLDFSPWEAKRAFGEGNFPGGGKETLAFLENDLIPYVKEAYGEVSAFFTCGYSLCGLFSLWALHESELLNGCVCASGSLWYPGWEEYSASNGVEDSSIVYLSLGNKEEKTRNPMMKRVGDATRKQDELLGRCSHILEWNPGGHFADSNERVGKGILWILNELKKTNNR